MPTTDADILRQAEAWRRADRQVALATVVETWGSAPRPVGSRLAVTEAGDFAGSVSGGCVEGAVITEAAEVIADGKPRLMAFGVADETAWDVGLAHEPLRAARKVRDQDRGAARGRFLVECREIAQLHARPRLTGRGSYR